MATAPSPNDLTRQQLDELDALLQRMLTLPLSPPDQVAVPPRPAPAVLEFAPLPLPVPAPPVRDATPPLHWRGEASPGPQLLAAPEPPRPPADPPPPPAPRRAPLPAPVEVVAPRVEEPPPPAPIPVPAPRPVAPTEPAAAPAEPVPLLLAPLVVLNRGVNGLLGLFGFPGRVLRSGFVKNLLGLTGFALLAYTAVKAAQVHLALPLTLPWPR